MVGSAISSSHHVLTLSSRWDDWVLEDRLRKATEENRELASNLRREVEASVRQKQVKPASKKRAMSDRSSVRDSEERGNSVPGRAGKRARGENDIEKVRCLPSFACSFPKVVVASIPTSHHVIRVSHPLIFSLVLYPPFLLYSVFQLHHHHGSHQKHWT